MRVLLAEYRESLRGLMEMLKQLEEREEELEYHPANAEVFVELEKVISDKALINGMIRNIKEVIQWIETGINPYFQQGIDSRYNYDISYRNMELIPDIYEQIKGEREELVLDDKQKEILRMVFQTLTEREVDCVVLHIANNYSMRETGEMIGIKKTTVQNHVENARKKIAEIVEWYGKGTK